MILLNLLPHRETARKKRRERFYATVALAAVCGFGVAVLAYSAYQVAISDQRANNEILSKEIDGLDQKIKAIKGLKAQIEALQLRQRAVEDVQADRNQSVHMLSELVRQLPAGVLLTKLVQTEQTVLISGSAQTNDQVSEFLRNLGGQSTWFSKPELIETAAGTVALTSKDLRPVFNFSLRTTLTRGALSAALAATPALGAASSPQAAPAGNSAKK